MQTHELEKCSESSIPTDNVTEFCSHIYFKPPGRLPKVILAVMMALLTTQVCLCVAELRSHFNMTESVKSTIKIQVAIYT